MNENGSEWNALSDLWQAARDGIDEQPLRTMVAAHRRRLVAVAIGETALLAGFLRLSWLFLQDGAEAWEIVWVVTLWCFAAVAAAFAWWNRRGLWNGIGRSVAEYERLRTVRRLHSVRFACALFLVEGAVVAAELAWFDRFGVAAALSLAAAAVVLGTWCLWMLRRPS